MRRPNARELYDFPRLVFPDGWAVNYRQDVDPEAVSDRPPFGHHFVGIWPNVQCVLIANRDESDNLFGRNRSITLDTVAVQQTDRTVDKHLPILKTRSTGVKRQQESPGIDANRRYLDWVASPGNETGGACVSQIQSHRKVSFDEKRETFKDADETPQSTPILTKETVNSEWGVDGDGPPHPSTEHREQITWCLAPSRRHISYKEGRHRESYDLDLLAFQAGSYASDEEEQRISRLT